jgi:hypothetical protein
MPNSFSPRRVVRIELELDSQVAEKLEEVQRESPEMLRRIVLYGLTRKSVFETFLDSTSFPESTRVPEPVF